MSEARLDVLVEEATVDDQVRQVISILDLPLPTPPPEGAEWIDAYRYWLR
ncbi:MAG: hypothetical protein LC799_10650 [Actinobacteria bacterium]|nr:hypothetical protein [Actinomycetota bacterium]